ASRRGARAAVGEAERPAHGGGPGLHRRGVSPVPEPAAARPDRRAEGIERRSPQRHHPRSHPQTVRSEGVKQGEILRLTYNSIPSIIPSWGRRWTQPSFGMTNPRGTSSTSPNTV